MDTLPSYGDAVARQDWLDLVAPYVPVADWCRCCQVDRRFYRRFAPRLWQDPLDAARRLGLHPNDDLAWYRRFINKHVKAVRRDTRRYVRCLDFRRFALRASGLYSSDASERAISESFKHLPEIFPGLICLLLDGHPELDPGSLADSTYVAQSSLQLLDLARCRYELTPKLFGFDLFRDLIYLDVSFVPGSVRSALYVSLNPRSLPGLRVLKVRGREMDNQTASLLLETFRQQLWSLDLSYNKLSDDVLDGVADHSISPFTFHTDAYYDKDGKLVSSKNVGSRKYGPFKFIQESQNSRRAGYFGRYLADSPLYSQRLDQTDPQEWEVVRPDGLAPLRRDDADTAKEFLLGEKVAYNSTWTLYGQPLLGYGGLTHLYLNGNRFTTSAVERLLRISRGRLEHFECDSCLYSLTRSQFGSRSLRVGILGFPGSAHLFRPVISSGIRSLRIHHSLVTQVPTVEIDEIPPAEAARISEGQIFKNMRRIYPLAFTPDTNPRIASITLTNIPARSTGPVIEQLIQFLQLARSQQNAIKEAREMFGARGPATLRGLRHIRLELAPDSSAGGVDIISAKDDVDFDKLLDPAEDSFSQDTNSGMSDADEEPFGITSRRQNTAVSGQKQQAEIRGGVPVDRATKASYADWKAGRLKSYPYSNTDSEYVTHQEADPARSWTGNVYSVPVWIGTGVLGPDAAANEYMWNVQDGRLRADVGPATPQHVAAGVPPLTYVYHAAWDAMAVPRNLAVPQPATRGYSSSSSAAASRPAFRDVAAAIKDYRFRTRDTPDHWDGKLELAWMA
ncbi:hypothetical protein GGS23DRAFT_234177 [Durotheca rogersii]|uniref:uncharacterized protein n=1 Tax=Durotheca rogersii TaxID=419775 RepID=UPI00221F0C95|nr:uncharacterized protein GGS23DRAFT_234177 [Durotheca rogersii]KAI5860359.1 hypothetical protein GGS23DRAFT_234177 [Durotheca rogersii]